MSQGGFCYSGCRRRKGGVRGRGHRQGAGREVQCSLGANQTRPSEQRLTFPINTGSRLALSPHLGSRRRLAPRPDCLPYSVDTGRLLRQSLASLTPVGLLFPLLQSYTHVPLHIAHSRTSTESKFPTRRQSSVCQFAHFDMF